MISDWNGSICGLLTKDVIPINDTIAFINDVVLVAVNVPFCVFAFLSNLVVIVAVVKKPVLHKPCYMLLCSLAFADCLTGVIAQPLLAVWRLMIHRAHISCDYQLKLYVLNRWTYRITSLLSFVIIAVMSFDRYNALTKPLQYRATANNRGAIKRAVFAGVSATLFVAATEVLLASNDFFKFLCGGTVVLFVVLTSIINHVRMFIAFRAHRNEVLGVSVSNLQRATILRREKTVAKHVMILSAALLICAVPAVFIRAFQPSTVQLFRYLFPWALSITFMNASVNPIINIWWNKELRNAIRSLESC